MTEVFYLFEPSVLDVELLGVDKVKQFAVFFSEGKKTGVDDTSTNYIYQN